MSVTGDQGPGGGDININLLIDSQVPVCGSTNITWTVDGGDPQTLLPLNLSIGYIGQSENAGTGELTNTVLLAQDIWTWDPIKVLPGLYLLSARAVNSEVPISGLSQQFAVTVVQNVAGLSCLSSPSNPISSAPISSPPSSPTSSPSSAANTNTASNPSITISVAPPPTISSSSQNSTSVTSSSTSMSTGLKAGLGVVGAVIAIAAGVALYWFLASRRRSGASSTGRYSTPGGRTGGGANRWNGLGSMDDENNNAASRLRGGEREIKSYSSVGDSVGYIPSATGAVGSHHTPSQVTHNTFSNTNTVYSHPHSPTFDEKPTSVQPVYDYNDYNYGYSNDGVSSYPPQEVSPGVAYSPTTAAGYATNIETPPRSPIYSSPAVQMVRSGSYSSSGSQLSRSLDSHDFPYPIAGVGGVPARNSQSSQMQPSTPQTSAAAVNRSNRKPVPTYSNDDTTLAQLDESNRNRTSTNSLTMDPFAGTPPESSSEHSHLSPPTPLPQLQHKSSFEKPMQHVLIPDMPPARVSSPPIGVYPTR